MTRRGLVIVAGVMALALIAAQADAVRSCRATQRRRDNMVLLSARDITGTLRWGATLGQEVDAFFMRRPVSQAVGHATVRSVWKGRPREPHHRGVARSF